MIINNHPHKLAHAAKHYPVTSDSALHDPSAQLRRLTSTACQTILTICHNSSDPQQSQSSEKDKALLSEQLSTVLKMAVSKNSQPLINFLLFRVPWFECPLLADLLHYLEKFARWYRTQGKQNNTVIYNVLAEGLLHAHSHQEVVKVFSGLMEGRYDSETLLVSLRENYPHKNRDLEAHKNYLKGLLALAEARPVLRGAILETIVERLSTIDTQIKIGDGQLTQPYLKEQLMMQEREASPSSDHMCPKLDALLDILISFLEGVHFGDDLAQEMLMIFHNKVLITEKNKFIQYLFYCLAEQNKRIAGFFLSMLLTTLLEASPNHYKQAYLNNLFYLGSYLIRSTVTPHKRVLKTLQEILQHINELLLKKNDVDIHSANLQQVFMENEIPLYLVQIVLYVCTYKPQVYTALKAPIQEMLLVAQQKSLYECFLNAQILNRFRVYCQRLEALPMKQEKQYCLNFQNKFNPVLLPLLAERVDPIFAFYKYQELTIAENTGIQHQSRRKNSCEEEIFEGKPSKRVKMLSEKCSIFSDDSTVQNSIRGEF